MGCSQAQTDTGHTYDEITRDPIRREFKMKVLAALFIIAVVSLAFLLNRKLDRKEEKKIAKKSQ